MAIVKTDNLKRFPVGVDTVLPHVGKVKLLADGSFEHSDNTAVANLLEDIEEFYEINEEGEPIKEKSENNDLGGDDDEDLDEDEDDEPLTAEQKEAYKTSLLSKTNAELQELCSPYPATEWRGKNKQALVDFIISKLP